jgi:hypothetical protein
MFGFKATVRNGLVTTRVATGHGRFATRHGSDATKPGAGKFPKRDRSPLFGQRVAMVGLWGMVGLGAVGGVLSFAMRPARVVFRESRPPAEAEGVAVRFVTSFVSAATVQEMGEVTRAYMGTAAQFASASPRPIAVLPSFPVGGKRVTKGICCTRESDVLRAASLFRRTDRDRAKDRLANLRFVRRQFVWILWSSELSPCFGEIADVVECREIALINSGHSFSTESELRCDFLARRPLPSHAIVCGDGRCDVMTGR